jgi:FAD/FMN-containing dehydrogenase
MASTTLYGLAVAFSLISSAVAVPSASTVEACNAINVKVPGKLFYPPEKQYKTEAKDYYNYALTELKPACITRPTTAQEVSDIVKILNRFPDVKFVVKSGGHSPNAGHSSINDGIIIALAKMKGVEYDKAKNLAYIKPGGQWNDVIGPLDKQGVTVVGGRLG